MCEVCHSLIVCRWVVLWSGEPQQVESVARIFKPCLSACPSPTEWDSVYYYNICAGTKKHRFIYSVHWVNVYLHKRCLWQQW